MDLIIAVLAITAGFFIGGARERKHFEDIKRREALLLAKLPIRTVRGPKLSTGEAFLVCGNVVIASDSFKDFIGTLKNFFGGGMTAQETLMDRARREAVLRMRESAIAQGAREIVEMHLETSFLDQMGAEVIAYGTAIR